MPPTIPIRWSRLSCVPRSPSAGRAPTPRAIDARDHRARARAPGSAPHRRRRIDDRDREHRGPTVSHLLVTNDFPPKMGGIQSYLWELWRRLPPDETGVLTTPYAGAAGVDAEQQFRIQRTQEPVLLPSPWLGRCIDRLADEVDAGIVVLDPALPLGLIGRHLR